MKGGEVIIGRAAVAWLRSQDFEVYQEVQCGQGGPVIDAVGVRGRLLVTIECKATFSLDVLEQAEHWTRKAHLSWVAVPSGKSSDSRRFAERVARHFGVGVLYVVPSLVDRDHERWEGEAVTEHVAPAFRRRVEEDEIREHLLEGQKTALAAGSAGGGRWTPFRNTCDAVERIVRSEPGIPLKDAVAKIPHHYSSPRSAVACLRGWIEAKRLRGVELRREGRALLLFPSGAT